MTQCFIIGIYICYYAAYIIKQATALLSSFFLFIFCFSISKINKSNHIDQPKHENIMFGFYLLLKKKKLYILLYNLFSALFRPEETPSGRNKWAWTSVSRSSEWTKQQQSCIVVVVVASVRAQHNHLSNQLHQLLQL